MRSCGVGPALATQEISPRGVQLKQQQCEQSVHFAVGHEFTDGARRGQCISAGGTS